MLTLFEFSIIFSFIMGETVLLLYLLLKTPAWAFLKASLRKRPVLIHTKENNYVEFIVPKPFGSLAFVKKRGYYLIDPKDVYIEQTSKVPTALVYGNFALTLNLKVAKLAQTLKKLGIKFYEDLVKLRENLEKKDQSLKINLLGESVDLREAEDLFNKSERSDFIEAEIQRRTSYIAAKKLRTAGDIFKWAVVLIIIMIGAALAYGIVVTVAGSQTVVPQMSKIIAPTPPQQAPPPVQNTTQGVVIE
ncbi:hypothetical protein DRJ16_00060 [Candidatus Woesearchaeota archaeon]|nr:MAG: hypothetical protein DRJ16_00060 [Candidatus Woesearchaeota archaeon]